MNDPGAAPNSTVRSAGPVVRAEGTMLGKPIARWRDDAREELGLPMGIILGTGHQAEWWHPGIVAKFAWAAHRSAELGLDAPAWLLVDTDVRDPLALRGLVALLVVVAFVLGGGGQSPESSIDELKKALNAENVSRSEERRVGKECVSLCRSRWSPYH